MNKHFSMNSVEFAADFILVPVMIVLLLYYNATPFWEMTAYIIFGVFSWTFYEYVMHRWLMHGGGPLTSQHDDHHRHPKALLGNKPWMTIVLSAVLWVSLYEVFGEDFASCYTVGVLWGYLVYCLIHVNIHHGNPAYLHFTFPRLYRHHIGHHRGGRHNFGVSTQLWDIIFRTLR